MLRKFASVTNGTVKPKTKDIMATTIIKNPNPTLVKCVFVALAVLCATPLVNTPVALCLGIAMAFLLGNPFASWSSKATGWLLKAAVVGLGFGMNMHSALQAGREGFLLTVFSIAVVLILGFVLGRMLGMERRTSHLVASGTAICGGSAIAAVAPVVKARPDEISVALGTVFLLNSVALLVFPPIGAWLDMSQTDFGTWCAIAIHDTSSVVGASEIYGEEALQTATTVKLARALWIIPVSLLSMWLFKGDGRKVSIPYFIGLFVLAMLANTFLPDITSVFNSQVVALSKIGLTITLFLIGTSLSPDRLRTVGFRPLVLGVMLWVVVSVGSLVAILW